MTTTPTVLDITQHDNTAARTGDKLKRRVAFVTGGTRGIGAAICRSLASQGAVLAAGYAGNDDAAGKFRDRFASTYGTEVSIHKGNVGDANDCRRTIEEVIATHGRLDILVNNAGITSDRSFVKMDHAAWRKVLAINLDGVFNCTKVFIDQMLQQGWGRVVNITSVIGQIGNFGQANYAASKAGVAAMTKSLAKELAAKGITINAVAPGFIETEMTAPVINEPKVQNWILRNTLLPRHGQPDDFDGALLLLASDAGRYITGQRLLVDGGWTAH